MTDLELKRLTDSFSGHGVYYAFNSKSRLARILWAIVLLAAFAGLVAEIHAIIDSFIDSPTATSLKMVGQAQMTFPDFIFCSRNYLSRAKLRQNNISDELATYLQLVSAANGQDMRHEKYINSLAEANEPQVELLRQSYLDGDLRQFIFDNGLSCEDFFGGCFKESIKANCCQHVQPVIDMTFGKCFLTRDLGKQTWLGSGGLQVKLAVNSNDIYPNILEEEADGFVVRIQSTYDPTEFEQVLLPVGFVSLIDLSEERIHLQNPVFGAKVCDETTHDNSFRKCYLYCYEMLRRELCKGCGFALDKEAFAPYYSEAEGPVGICSPMQALHCGRTVWSVMYENNSAPSWFQECVSNCLPSCKRTEYRKSNSIRQMKHSSDNVLKANVELSFARFGYLLVQELSTITPESVIANVGGAMGVFLGASFITLIEVVVLFFSYISRGSCKSKAKHKVTRSK